MPVLMLDDRPAQRQCARDSSLVAMHVGEAGTGPLALGLLADREKLRLRTGVVAHRRSVLEWLESL